MRRAVSLLVIVALGATASSATAEPESEPAETGPFIESGASPSDDDGPNRLRVGVEVGLTLAIATVRYQLDGKRKKNWDFPSFKQRLTLEAWRYDNNPFGINYLWHAVEGVAFHLIARSNDMSLIESAAVGFGASFAWEFLFEFKEKVSINDVIFTPASGVIVGEFFHWLGRYLDSAPATGGLGYDIARYTLGAPTAIHRKLDGTGPTYVGPRDNLGLRSDIWHRFELGATAHGIRSDDIMETPGGVGSARAAGRLVVIDGYRSQRSFGRWFRNANFTEASYEFTLGEDTNGSRFRGESVIMGGYSQQIDDSGGRGGMAGIALSYDYRRERIGDWQERLALLHLPGPALDGELHGRDWTLAARARLHPDFGSVHAIGKVLWEAQNPDAVGKTIIRKQGYTFGWGASARGELELTATWPIPISLGGAALIAASNSDENLDRTQETLTIDERVSDRLLELDGWVRFRPLPKGPWVELRGSHQRHNARHDGLEASQRLSRLGVGVWLPF